MTVKEADDLLVFKDFLDIVVRVWLKRLKKATGKRGREMTREQANNYLKSSGFTDEQITEIEQAFRGEPSEDCISRQAAIDINFKRIIFATTKPVEMIEQKVKALPPVTPQQKIGHWEWTQYEYNPELGNWHCSECRCIVTECAYKNEEADIPLYRYCPQCGAKMQEAEE